jgi:hypothetical protein
LEAGSRRTDEDPSRPDALDQALEGLAARKEALRAARYAVGPDGGGSCR